MLATKNITLYAGLCSPFPHRVQLALEEAGIPYDTIWIDLVAKPSWYAEKVYPVGKVPFFVYGGPKLQANESPSPEAITLPESSVILEFLVDTFPNAHLLPSDPFLRAKARLFGKAVDERFCKAFMEFFYFGHPLEEFLVATESMQALLAPAGFALGQQWSIADATFVPVLLLAVTRLKFRLGSFAEDDVPQRALDALESPRFARLKAYLDDNMARQSMARTWDEDASVAQLRRLTEKMAKSRAAREK